MILQSKHITIKHILALANDLSFAIICLFAYLIQSLIISTLSALIIAVNFKCYRKNMSPITKLLIEQGGIQQEYIILLLGLPIISVIIGISRYYIGIKTFSLYTPIILTTAFYQISTSYQGDSTSKILAGSIIGIAFTIIVISSVILVEKLTKKVRLHYFPKMSLLFSFAILSLFITLVFLELFNLFQINNIDMFSLILIAIVYESFITTYIKKNLKVSIKLAIETITLSLICYTFLILNPVRTLLLNQPGVVLLTIPINYIIGRFTGLRLSEYFRFQDILNKEEVKE